MASATEKSHFATCRVSRPLGNRMRPRLVRYMQVLPFKVNAVGLPISSAPDRRSLTWQIFGSAFRKENVVSDIDDRVFADGRGRSAEPERFEGALWRNIALLEKLRSPESCRAYLQEAVCAGVTPEELRVELVRLAGIVLETNAMLVRAAGIGRKLEATHAGESAKPHAPPKAFDWRNMASCMPLLATAALAIETAHELAARHPMAGGQSSVAGWQNVAALASRRSGPPPT